MRLENRKRGQCAEGKWKWNRMNEKKGKENGRERRKKIRKVKQIEERGGGGGKRCTRKENMGRGDRVYNEEEVVKGKENEKNGDSET